MTFADASLRLLNSRALRILILKVFECITSGGTCISYIGILCFSSRDRTVSANVFCPGRVDTFVRTTMRAPRCRCCFRVAWDCWGHSCMLGSDSVEGTRPGFCFSRSQAVSTCLIVTVLIKAQGLLEWIRYETAWNTSLRGVFFGSIVWFSAVNPRGRNKNLVFLVFQVQCFLQSHADAKSMCGRS